ncbi:SGNH/GDSL hydrolase family protein [Agrococcus jejuensis]|uniref:SGNH/GDSL hydrolase family protein n=1 Tax=Agrococcus jejuensis TaxID=399736 RepID=UPI0011A5B093|nr:SGNH/GDSL hydrolase family protein [Agrococcus jejuensis]
MTRSVVPSIRRRPARWVATLAASAVALVGCTTGPSTTPAASPTATTSDQVVRMAVVGDSITDADSPDLANGDLGAQSWVAHAVDDEVAFAGGWAEWGARTAQMADAIAAPFDADVLVILAGTNDALGDDLAADVGAQLVRIVERAGVDEVVVSSIPPLASAPDRSDAVNDFLEPFVAQQGWTWVDASAGLRDGDGFVAGTSYDGVHLTEAGAGLLGAAIRTAVVDAAP